MKKLNAMQFQYFLLYLLEGSTYFTKVKMVVLKRKLIATKCSDHHTFGQIAQSAKKSSGDS